MNFHPLPSLRKEEEDPTTKQNYANLLSITDQKIPALDATSEGHFYNNHNENLLVFQQKFPQQVYVLDKKKLLSVLQQFNI